MKCGWNGAHLDIFGIHIRLSTCYVCTRLSAVSMCSYAVCSVTLQPKYDELILAVCICCLCCVCVYVCIASTLCPFAVHTYVCSWVRVCNCVCLSYMRFVSCMINTCVKSNGGYGGRHAYIFVCMCFCVWRPIHLIIIMYTYISI